MRSMVIRRALAIALAMIEQSSQDFHSTQMLNNYILND